MDFDDLIYHTVKLLQNDEEARRYYQDKFKLRSCGRVSGHQPLPSLTLVQPAGGRLQQRLRCR